MISLQTAQFLATIYTSVFDAIRMLRGIPRIYGYTFEASEETGGDGKRFVALWRLQNGLPIEGISGSAKLVYYWLRSLSRAYRAGRVNLYERPFLGQGKNA